MNVCFKKAVICFCIVGFLFAPLRPYRANAIAVVDDCIIIGGVLVTTYVVVLALEKAGAFQGFDVNTSYSSDLSSYLSKKVLALSSAEIAKYFFTAKDTNGTDYVALTSDGYDWNKDNWDAIDAGLKDFRAFTRSLTSNTTTNTVPNTLSPYMLNGFYMVPYLSTPNKLFDSFNVAYGDTLYVQLVNSDGTVKTKTIVPYGDCSIKILQDSTSYIQVWVSYDNWVSRGSPIYCQAYAHEYFKVGYYTTSQTVYIPSTDVVTNTGSSTAIGSDEAVAVPISGQYSSDGTTRIYDGIDGCVATAVTGLKAVDLSNTGAGANTGEGTQTGFWDSLWNWLQNIIDGIKAIPKLILDWFTIDWDKVKTHINYIDIVKQHFQPISDIFDLISNVSADIKDSDGKFYMVIPHEMGGDDQEHCVLDLSVGAVYITTARDVIKYGMWMGFVWYVFRKFDPKFSI